MGLLPQRGGETRASRQVGSICLLGRTEQWLQTRCLEGPWGVIYNKEAWERDQHSRQSASRVGIYRASPMVLGGQTSPELTCYLLFLKRSQGSRFFLVCPHVYIFTTYCFFFNFFENPICLMGDHFPIFLIEMQKMTFSLLCFTIFKFLIWNLRHLFQIFFLHSPPRCAGTF